MGWVGLNVQDALTSSGCLGFFVAKACVGLAGKDAVACISNDISPLANQGGCAVMQLENVAVVALSQGVFNAFDFVVGNQDDAHALGGAYAQAAAHITSKPAKPTIELKD